MQVTATRGENNGQRIDQVRSDFGELLRLWQRGFRRQQNRLAAARRAADSDARRGGHQGRRQPASDGGPQHHARRYAAALHCRQRRPGPGIEQCELSHQLPHAHPRPRCLRMARPPVLSRAQRGALLRTGRRRHAAVAGRVAAIRRSGRPHRLWRRDAARLREFSAGRGGLLPSSVRRRGGGAACGGGRHLLAGDRLHDGRAPDGGQSATHDGRRAPGPVGSRAAGVHSGGRGGGSHCLAGWLSADRGRSRSRRPADERRRCGGCAHARLSELLCGR